MQAVGLRGINSRLGQGVMDPVVQGLKLFEAAGEKGSIEQEEKESL